MQLKTWLVGRTYRVSFWISIPAAAGAGTINYRWFSKSWYLSGASGKTACLCMLFALYLAKILNLVSFKCKVKPNPGRL